MWDGSRDDDHDDNDYDGRRLADFDVINLNLMKALPLSINLTQLHTPDLIHLVRRDRRQEATRKKESQLDSQEAGKEGMLGLLQRAESIGHPELKATDVLGLFKHRRTTSPVPSLESLKIHLKIYNCRGGINPVLLANPAYAGWLSHPRLRKLALSGTYEQFQFGSNFFCDPYNLEFQPSFAPLLNYAQLFAETLDVLALEIRNVDDEYTSDNDNDNHDEEWTGEFNSQDYDPGEYGLNLTIPFPSLCQLALRSTKTAVGVRLCSLDKTRFPGLKSCLCDISPASPGGAAPDLEYFADRIPGLKVAAVSGEVDSLTQRVAGWIRERDAEQAPERDNYRQRLRHTVEHLNEWYRSAADAQDSDALVQIREALESVDIRKTVIEAWAGSASGPDLVDV